MTKRRFPAVGRRMTKLFSWSGQAAFMEREHTNVVFKKTMTVHDFSVCESA